MTIAKEAVADLRPGDVVELRLAKYPDFAISGPVRSEYDALFVGYVVLKHWRPDRPGILVSRDDATLTVISRAPRPLYVNHSRVDPVQGDVVRFEDQRYPDSSYTDLYDPRTSPGRPWLDIRHGERWQRAEAEPRAGDGQRMRLRLLVDGETGQVVP